MPETVRVAFASEREMSGLFGPMRLLCGPENVDLSRVSSRAGMAFLMDHQGDRPAGRVRRAALRNRVAFAEVDLVEAPRNAGYLEELRGGLRDGISPGILIHKVDISETDDGEISFDITFWEPYEISSTPIPRNPDAGIVTMEGSPTKASESDPSTEGAPSRLRRRSARERTERQPSARALATTQASMKPVPQPTITKKTEGQRMTELEALEKRVDAKLAAHAMAGDTPETVAGLPLHEAISGLAALGQNPSGTVLRGLENVQVQRGHAQGQAALQASDIYGSETTTTEIGDIQPQGRRAERLLRQLRQARIPYGSQRFPVLASAPTAGMVVEGMAPLTIVDASFTDPAPTAQPHAAQTRAKFSLLSVIQGGDVFRDMVDDSMATALAALMATQLVSGDGSGANVRGLLNTPNVGTSQYTLNDRGTATSFETAEDVLDAAEYGAESRPTWLLSPDLYRTARKTLRQPGDQTYVLGARRHSRRGASAQGRRTVSESGDFGGLGIHRVLRVGSDRLDSRHDYQAGERGRHANDLDRRATDPSQ